MIIHIRIAGSLLICLAFLHLVFPRYFKWRHELGNLSLINRQIVFVHTFFIGLSLLLMGLLCLFYSKPLLTTSLGHVICFGLGVFWLARLLVQFFVYSPLLWKGKRFETAVHIVFSLLWTYLTATFLNGYFQFL